MNEPDSEVLAPAPAPEPSAPYPRRADLIAVAALAVSACPPGFAFAFGGPANRDQSLSARAPKPHRKFPVPSRKGKR